MRNLPLIVTLAILVLTGSTDARAADGVAIIDGDVVSYEEFERMVYTEARQTFYHGASADSESYRAFRREVAQKLVDRKLKLREARRLGMKTEEEYIARELASHKAKYGGTERWDKEGDEILERLAVHFEEESLIEQIDVALRHVEAPSDAKLREYYEANIEKFTQPEQVRLSVILLQVPAWADSATWNASREKASKILAKIHDGQDFADAARMHSDDPSAEKGGDIGYVHAGIMDGELLKVVSELGAGEISSGPVTVLEGVVLVRVEDRRAAQVHTLDEVRERATGLWQREASEQAYEASIASLRAASDIQLDESYLEKLPE